MNDSSWDSPEVTERAGELLGECLRAGDLIGLIGDLGAGKTAFVRGVARGLSVPPDMRVTSPTFTLVNEYHGGRIPLYHADLYRIEHEIELDEIGLEDLRRRGDGAVCVEWHDRFATLGRDVLELTMRVTGDAERAVGAAATGPRSRELLAAWRDRLVAALRPAAG